MARCEFLSGCACRLERARLDFDETIAQLSSEQATWKPSSKVWSVAQCIDHANVSAGLYFDRIEPAIERARERGLNGSAPYGRGTFLGRMILRVLEPGAGRTFPAPGSFRPAAEPAELEELADEFRGVIETLDELMEKADGLELGRIRFTTPAGPILKVTLAEAFEIQSLHIPRHLEQAQRVTRMEGFPG